MKRRLFYFTIIILIAGLVSFLTVSLYITNRNNLSIAKSTVEETARICAGLFDDSADLREFVSVGENTRITVISSEGTVLADSHPSQTESGTDYLTRPEILAAARRAPQVHVRHSSTHDADFIYYALMVPTNDGHVFVRASMPVAEIDSYLFQSLPMLLILLAVFAVICFFVIRDVANRILSPFSTIESRLRRLSLGEYVSENVKSYDEINKITREIDDVALVLQNSFTALSDEKNKLGFIINSIGDGIFAVDESIALANIAALNLFGATEDVIGKKLNYLISDKILLSAVEECASGGKNALFELLLNGKIFLATIKRLPETDLTMVILTDITETRENAKRREEFFANASHELKTPLTAIKGFNELLSINNKDEGMEKFISGITRETNRMMSLIGDMLKLSELENTQEVSNPVPISLSKIINEAVETMSTAIGEKSVSFSLTGDAVVISEPNHLFEIVKNLIENAVRYNNDGGKIYVKITDGKKKLLTVSDNGIGISPGEQTKIFERFYQVEKSRSNQGGGTGLGLSIVKHICALYGWKLSLKSKLGIGTDVTVEF